MRLIHIVIAAALGGTPAAASAQVQFRDRPDPLYVVKEPMKAAEGRRMVNSFARCVARKRKAKAEAVLALPYGTQEQSEAAWKIIGNLPSCFEGPKIGRRQIHIEPQHLVGGMAEELALARYAAAGGESLARLTPEQLALPAAAPRNGAETFGQCVVLRDPAGTKAFIGSEIGSPDENKSAAGLLPHLEQCLTEGQTLALNRPALRILLAVALHRVLSLPASNSPE